MADTTTDIKPGLQTTEFWQTLIATIVPNLITLLVLSKVVPENVASSLTASLVAVINGAITVWVTIKYSQVRSDLKKSYISVKENAKERRSSLLKEMYARKDIDSARLEKEMTSL